LIALAAFLHEEGGAIVEGQKAGKRSKEETLADCGRDTGCSTRCSKNK